jgi:UDP-N-acetyl-D-mannosaminuronic acid transferase (WecB/TagA/CpsF family)
MVDRLLKPEPLQSRRILRTRVDATSYRHATGQVLDWAAAGESRYVCVATVNNLIEGCDDPGYNALMEAAGASRSASTAARTTSWTTWRPA